MVVDDRFGIAKPTTNIGLGCGRLVGRDGLRESSAIVETALELGIRHFDVAPSYGMGTAEEVLGAVLGSVPDVTVCTKVGIARPEYSRRRYLARTLVRRVLPRRSLRRLGRGTAARSAGRERRPFAFTDEAIRMSLAESLERLRRESVDLFLLHQPAPSDLNRETAGILDGLVGEGLVRAYGVGIDEVGEQWAEFGSVWQSRWPGDTAERYRDDVTHVFHGALRYAGAHLGDGRLRPAEVIRRVTERKPGCVLLVSASSPRRLRELMEDV